MRKNTLILLVLLIVGKAAANEQKISQSTSKFDTRAIVVLGYLDWRQDASGAIKVPRVAFAIGDGTLLLTAAHCVYDFRVEPDEPISIDKIIISPYYGDMFDFQIVAMDKQADIAILKAPWTTHPALSLASEEEYEAVQNILIASRPQSTFGSMHFGREIETELLPVVYRDSNNPTVGLRLKGTKKVVPGWSGSPMLIPGSDTVAGILTRSIVGIKSKLFGLITLSSRNDAAGCNIYSIRELINRKRLRQAAFASPAKLENIPDAERGFSRAIDFIEALMSNNEKESFQIAENLTRIRPNSVQAHLMLALSSILKAKDPNISEQEYLEIAETNYKKALQLDPNNAYAHASYGNFLIRTQRKKEALEQCNASLAIDPNNRMALFNKFIVADSNERKETAEHLLTIEPNNPLVWFHYSSALRSKGEDEKALEAAQKAVELDPNGLFYGGLADALMNLQRVDEAETYYKLMTEKCGCQSCWFKYANFLVANRSNKLDEAAKALKKARSLSRMRRVSEENMNLLELKLLSKTSPEQGEVIARDMLDASPDNGHYWFFFAGVLRTLEKYDEAVEAAQKAVDLCPDLSYRPRLANCLAKVGEYEKAEQIYHDLHEEFPERNRYWFWYAEFLVDYLPERIDEAKDALEKASSNPDAKWFVPPEDLEELQQKIEQKTEPLPVATD
ncbi:MAG: tetratricopeptide repeat protein [Sedimentisphaerales bacterium]